jgi:hypothetical protein
MASSIPSNPSIIFNGSPVLGLLARDQAHNAIFEGESCIVSDARFSFEDPAARSRS